jgi:hypothetical protein
MAKLREPVLKHLSDTGAVTTDNKSGILYKVIFTGATVGDKLEVKDGATTMLTLITSTANEPVSVELPKEHLPIFTTDIAATFTKTGAAYATFLYEEIGS